MGLGWVIGYSILPVYYNLTPAQTHAINNQAVVVGLMGGRRQTVIGEVSLGEPSFVISSLCHFQVSFRIYR